MKLTVRTIKQVTVKEIKDVFRKDKLYSMLTDDIEEVNLSFNHSTDILTAEITLDNLVVFTAYKDIKNTEPMSNYRLVIYNNNIDVFDVLAEVKLKDTMTLNEIKDSAKALGKLIRGENNE